MTTADAGRQRVLFCAETANASTWYRAHVPGDALRDRGYEFTLTSDPMPSDVERCDTFAARVPVGPKTWRALDYAKSLGKRCVLDLDDDVWSLHPDNPAFEHFRASGAGEHARAAIRRADLVTTPTEYLAELVSPMNRSVAVVPNALPADRWPATPKDLEHGGPVVVGWAGSSSHGPDVAILSGVVEAVLSSCPDVRFAFSYTLDLPFGNDERIELLPAVPIEEYAGMVERFDVGLAPLLDSRFNRAKSDLKILEYGICGIPAVASKVLPYVGAIDHNASGLIAASPKDWIKSIRRLVEDPELRSRLGAAARVRAERRTVDRVITKWIDAYGLSGTSRQDDS